MASIYARFGVAFSFSCRRHPECYPPIHPGDFNRRRRLQTKGHIIVFTMGEEKDREGVLECHSGGIFFCIKMSFRRDKIRKSANCVSAFPLALHTVGFNIVNDFYKSFF